MRRLLLVVVAVMAVLSGCAATSSGGISAKASTALSSYVEAVRTAAAGTSVTHLRAAVRALDGEAELLVQGGELTQQQAVNIENQADIVITEYGVVNPKPKPSVTPTSATPTPTPSSATPTPTPSSTTPTPTPSTTPPTPSVSPSTPATKTASP